MAIFTVMAHPDGDGCNEFLKPHVDNLLRLLEDLNSRRRTTQRYQACAGFLIVSAADLAAVEAVEAANPFSVKGLIVDLVIMERDPVLSTFHDVSQPPAAGRARCDEVIGLPIPTPGVAAMGNVSKPV